MKKSRTAVIVLILIFSTGCASLRSPVQLGTSAGTPATQSWESVAFIPVVSSVTVDLTTGETITGRFRSADERELVLEQNRLLRRLPRTEIRWVILYQGRHTGRGTLWGLAIGAGSGLAAGIKNRPASDPVVLPDTLLGSGLGAAGGALVGTLVRERAVIYEVP